MIVYSSGEVYLYNKTVDYDFDEQGSVLKRDSHGASINAVQVIIKNHKLDRLYSFDGAFLDFSRALVVDHIHHDDQGVIKDFTKTNVRSDAISDSFTNPIITFVSYDKGIQHSKTYTKIENKIVEIKSEDFIFDTDGGLLEKYTRETPDLVSSSNIINLDQ